MREPSTSIGRLVPSAVQISLIEQTIEFVWGCLIPWRNDPDRPFAEGEEELNAQFHNFLQSRACEIFPMVLFQHEQRQEGRRRVDLSVKPIKKVVIEGVTYTKYHPIFVIEGKRLPPPSKTREREYVSGGRKFREVFNVSSWGCMVKTTQSPSFLAIFSKERYRNGILASMDGYRILHENSRMIGLSMKPWRSYLAIVKAKKLEPHPCILA